MLVASVYAIEARTFDVTSVNGEQLVSGFKTISLNLAHLDIKLEN